VAFCVSDREAAERKLARQNLPDPIAGISRILVMGNALMDSFIK